MGYKESKRIIHLSSCENNLQKRISSRGDLWKNKELEDISKELDRIYSMKNGDKFLEEVAERVCRSIFYRLEKQLFDV